MNWCAQGHAAQRHAEVAQASVANPLGWPGRETNEPAASHRSLVVEDMGGDPGSFVLVPR